MAYLLLAASAAGLSALLTPLVRRLAVQVGAIDRPGARRVHEIPVPRLGGLAIFGASLGTLALAWLLGRDVVGLLAARGWQPGWLLAGALVTVATGALDDIRGLTPRVKLALLAGAAAIALLGGYGLAGFTNPFTGAYVHLGFLGGAATLVWIVALTSAFNLVDGLDGLAGGVALIASLTLLAISLLEGRVEAALLWSVLVGALVGFLPYNFFPASIFLGDSGSLLLGYLLAVLALQSLQKGATLVVVIVPVVAVGLPVMELALTVTRRTLATGARSVLDADREHIHHRLLGHGLTHRGAVLVLYGVSVVLGGVAFLAVLVQGPVNAIIVAVASAAMFAAIRWLGWRRPGQTQV